jgi:type IV fimbrial biogenesis protein FimT
MRRPHTHSAGFTILELMITVSILAVLLGIGVPAFGDIIRNNRLATETNNLVGALNLARAEAAKRGIPVAVCAAAITVPPAAPSCSGGTDWSNGWLVFTDRIGVEGEYTLGATATDPKP